MTFAFDDQFTMFDVTPVDNQFILEQLPGAKGDYVKVYLYGLLYCYHPKQEMNLDAMCHDLNMTKDEITAAYRYWERHGAVIRISDHPPEWRYVNFRQRIVTTEEFADPDYAAFCREVEQFFDGVREFRGSEIASVYEWKEDLQLPAEVILMILNHMARTRGKNFRIADAEKVAVRLADENARSEEEAAEALSRDEAAISGMRKILRLLGKRYMPSEANMALYTKWTQTWGFTQEAIEEACSQTGTNDPSLALVDAILQKTWERNRTAGSGKLGGKDVQASADLHENIKKVMREIGRTGVVTSYQEDAYRRMLQLYPQEIIMVAARECGRKKKDPESVLKLLQAWKKRGFVTLQDVEQHIDSFRDKESFLQQIRARWSNRESDAGEHSLELLSRWEDSLGMSRELIMKAADYAAEARRPMSYMDALMTRYAEKGIRTPEQAEADHREYAAQYHSMEKKTAEKNNPAQQYEQRSYTGVQEAAIERMMKMGGRNNNA